MSYLWVWHQPSCPEQLLSAACILAAALAMTMDNLLHFFFGLTSPGCKAQMKIFSCLPDKADVQIN